MTEQHRLGNQSRDDLSSHLASLVPLVAGCPLPTPPYQTLTKLSEAGGSLALDWGQSIIDLLYMG